MTTTPSVVFFFFSQVLFFVLSSSVLCLFVQCPTRVVVLWEPPSVLLRSTLSNKNERHAKTAILLHARNPIFSQTTRPLTLPPCITSLSSSHHHHHHHQEHDHHESRPQQRCHHDDPHRQRHQKERHQSKEELICLLHHQKQAAWRSKATAQCECSSSLADATQKPAVIPAVKVIHQH
mmetsp:Transcript_27358/g.84005  ORF Transcript_27358/g.84005 Transcript_27358/m.84005 type:complete len:178 (+) Transcript_27358:695-1228(+)